MAAGEIIAATVGIVLFVGYNWLLLRDKTNYKKVRQIVQEELQEAIPKSKSKKKV